MKTPFDCLNILYDVLTDSPLDTEMNGAGYRLKRPTGSTGEDWVINSLPVSGDQLQRGVANVNLYVPDLRLHIGGKPQTMPDAERMEALTELAKPLLEERYQANNGAFAFQIAGIQVIEEPETDMHYVNLRVDFQFFPSI